MDRNTVTGLILIGLILSVFAIFNQPSEEEQKKMAEKAKKEKAEKEKKTEEKKADEKPTYEAHWIKLLDDDGNPVPADSGMVVMTDTVTGQLDTVAIQPEKVEAPVKEEVKGRLIELETDKLIVTFNTKGGIVASVRLKEYESYKNYRKRYDAKTLNDGNITPLELFKNGDATNGIILPMKGEDLNTAELEFSVKDSSDNKIVFEYLGDDKESIEFVYQLKDGKFDLDYDINIRGFSGKVNPKNVMYNWDVAYRKTERLFSEQRRVSTVCFNYKDEGFSYLSEITDDEAEAEDKVDWVSFKQSYFSSFIRPENGFGKDGSKFEVKTYDQDHERAYRNIKDFKTTLNLNLNNVDNASVRMNWYFGPNDYKVLKSYGKDYDNILNYGWGIFRWINIYAVQPLFSFLKSTGMGIGLVILLLTFIIKSALMPVQWKMYSSSAKMRILKPEIDALNEKYPEKEDAMKKQMEMMSLYRESGASPLSGCVPMLIQMPILLAVFRFFPSTFDLRQKSFLWAEDLSSYDSIVDLPFDIWFYGDHISLFTLLMAGTTLAYTFMNSSNMATPQQPGMPNMKIIMYFFPIMMIFFFNNYSSGLSYYYFISTLSSILIMLAIKKFFVDEDKIKAKMAARKAAAAGGGSNKKTKSKFQERLEQMQKTQMEQRKNNKK